MTDHYALPGLRDGAAPPPDERPFADTTTRLSAIAFDRHRIVEAADCTLDEISRLKRQGAILWVHVEGKGDDRRLQALAEAFGLHGLAMEDVLEVHQRPKAEEYEDHLFVVARIARPDATGQTQQVALFIGDGYVLTFQEYPQEWLEPVRRRLRQQSARVRGQPADYLAYLLLDRIVDGYFPVLEALGEELEALEHRALNHPGHEVFEEIHNAKRRLLANRRILWPLRDMLARLVQGDIRFVSPDTHVYLRDCYDHAVQLMDIIETYREIAAEVSELYLAGVSTRLNETMKVLTIIATLFMPLGFITGLYGMNFDTGASAWNMPELGWRFGYPFALALMAATVALLLLYFQRKRWIGRRAASLQPSMSTPPDSTAS